MVAWAAFVVAVIALILTYFALAMQPTKEEREAEVHRIISLRKAGRPWQ